MSARWQNVKLGEVFDISSSKRVHQRDWKTSGVPFYRAREIVKLAEEGVVQNELFISEELYEENRAKFGIPRPGDLMISAVGTLGACYIVKPTDRFYYKDASVLRLSPKQPICAKFIQYAFRTREILDQVYAGSGSTVGTYTIARANETRMRLPPLAEQRRIAVLLDRAEVLRSKRRAALAQLDTLTQSIFLHLLRQAGKDVETVSIGDGMETIIDYRGKSPNKTERGIPLITARVVKGGELLEPNEFIAEDDFEAWMRRGLPKAGDVLFTTEAPLGEVAQLDGRKVALAQRLLVLRGKPALFENTFLKYALTAREVRKQIAARATGSTVRGIRQTELRKVMLPKPSIQSQRRFARQMEAVEKLKAVQRTSLAELDALFSSLQHRAFRGEL